MCGIAGVVGAEGSEIREVVLAMNAAMAHRGPDDMGVWQKGAVCLGHRRLAIIDCSPAGHQPMTLETQAGTHALTFNGEIYNFNELREELVSKGERLVSRSDTEVLLHLLICEGAESALQRLAGMFAFGYWDPRTRTLLIARDRVGIKPVYYHLSPDGVLTFASSVSALMENSRIPRRINGEALEEFLATGCPIAPNTMYEGVFELPPGQMLKWAAGRISIRSYWEVEWDNRFSGTEDEAKERFRQVLDRSLREHLVSDVPVGAFLSGGLDSSTVVARAAKFTDASFEAFTIKFQEAKYDESSVARDVAERVGVKHSVIPMATMPVDADFCRLALKHVGQPFADSSCLPSFLVSTAASKHVKVVLSGDGGDELFAGYESFAWAAKIERTAMIPNFARRLALYGMSSVEPMLRSKDWHRQITKGLKYSFQPREEMLLRLKCIFDPEEIAAFTEIYGGSAPRLERLRNYLSHGAQYDLVTALARWHSVFLVADMLRKVDCMSMAASIEVRVPLLDHRIVEFAHSLPVNYKMRGNVRKWLLREVVRPELPPSVFTHPKWGFSIPLHRALTEPFIQESCELLMSRGSYVRGLIRPKFLEALSRAMRSRTRLNDWSLYKTSHMFWMLIQLEIWVKENRVSTESHSMRNVSA